MPTYNFSNTLHSLHSLHSNQLYIVNRYSRSVGMQGTRSVWYVCVWGGDASDEEV